MRRNLIQLNLPSIINNILFILNELYESYNDKTLNLVTNHIHIKSFEIISDEAFSASEIKASDNCSDDL